MRAPFLVTPRPDRQTLKLPPRVLPHFKRFAFVSPGTGLALLTMRSRFWRTDATCADIVTSLPHFPTVIVPSLKMTTDAPPVLSGRMARPSVEYPPFASGMRKPALKAATRFSEFLALMGAVYG